MIQTKRDIEVYVPANVVFDESGWMFPRGIVWEDCNVYEIDKLLDVRPAYAARAGIQGDRYTIEMRGKETYIIFEHSSDLGSTITERWFVKRREV